MINNKDDLKYYLAKDKKMLHINKKYPTIFKDEVWKFQIALRKAEYAVNCKKGIVCFPYRLFRKFIFHTWSVKLGFSIPLNVFDEGLSIAHYGTIAVNANAHVGKNCRIQEGVTIGASGDILAPQIANNVFIGSGAKILGNIYIADGIAVGAGAVVTKSFYTPNVTIAGVPAKVISKKGSNSVYKFVE